MRCPTLQELPPSPPGKSGWPWSEESKAVPPTKPNGDPWPTITIVTPSYNQGEFIEETIRSVLLQNYPNLEYIIMDGGSTDGSVEIIKKYERWLAHWESKKDEGQAHAINKALTIATGIWFHNINSDDLLAPNALEIIGNCDTKSDLIASPVLNFGGKKSVTKNFNLNVENLLKIVWNDDSCSWHQPGLIMKREVLSKVGGYPTRFNYVFDFIALCKYLEKYGRIETVEGLIAQFRVHDQSKTGVWGERQERELFEARIFLSSDLETPRFRRLAKKEAYRRKLRNSLQGNFKTKVTLGLIWNIFSQVLLNPYLLLDRSLLFFIRVKLNISKY